MLRDDFVTMSVSTGQTEGSGYGAAVHGLPNWDRVDAFTGQVPDGSRVRALADRLGGEFVPVLHLSAWADVELDGAVEASRRRALCSVHYHDGAFYQNPEAPSSLLIVAAPKNVDPSAWAQLLVEGSAAIYFAKTGDLLSALTSTLGTLAPDDPKSFRTDSQWRAALRDLEVIYVEPADDLLRVQVSGPDERSIDPVLEVLREIDAQSVASAWYREHVDRLVWNDDLGYLALTPRG